MLLFMILKQDFYEHKKNKIIIQKVINSVFLKLIEGFRSDER